jgi:hypothetical protein
MKVTGRKFVHSVILLKKCSRRETNDKSYIRLSRPLCASPSYNPTAVHCTFGRIVADVHTLIGTRFAKNGIPTISHSVEDCFVHRSSRFGAGSRCFWRPPGRSRHFPLFFVFDLLGVGHVSPVPICTIVAFPHVNPPAVTLGTPGNVHIHRERRLFLIGASVHPGWIHRNIESILEFPDNAP